VVARKQRDEQSLDNHILPNDDRRDTLADALNELNRFGRLCTGGGV
jgi:hypothetical protein